MKLVFILKLFYAIVGYIFLNLIFVFIKKGSWTPYFLISCDLYCIFVELMIFEIVNFFEHLIIFISQQHPGPFETETIRSPK